jgi:MFS family permease
MYSLGAICALPFVPLAVDRFGRRFAILLGSCIMLLGSGLQGGAQTCRLKPFCVHKAKLTLSSPDVLYVTLGPWSWNPVCNRLCIVIDRR